MLYSLAQYLRRMASLVREPLGGDPLGRRDAAFIAEETEVLGGILDAWYRPEVSGLEHLPPGRALIVGTHNGGWMAPDMFALMVAFWRRFGVERTAYGLAHDVVFRLPGMGAYIAKLGAVPAHPGNAAKLLERDVAVLVYPGGDRDAYKPYRDRHVVSFAGRHGFIRTARATGAPIVPVVSVGAHEIFRVLSDGHGWAERLGLKKLRIAVVPVYLAAPWGLQVGPFMPFLPMPTRVRIRVLPPVPADEADPERLRADMQRAVDELVAEGGFGVRAWFARRENP